MTERITSLPGIPPRRRDAHKGDFGRILIVACSPGMTGAGCMAALGAQRAGGGLVTLALPESLSPIAEAKLTGAMTLPLPEAEGATIGRAAASVVLEAAPQFDAFAIGPGVRQSEETQEAVRRLVAGLAGPVVVDADGLNAVAGDLGCLSGRSGQRLLTPHPGEMARLMGVDHAGLVQADREGAAVGFARAHGVLVALKGAQTVVTDGQRVFVSPTGNPGMATGGSGDVLTGMAAALLCQGLGELDALVLAVFVRGLAGDMAARETGELSLVPEDILAKLPAAFERVREAGEGADPGDVPAA